MSESQCNSATGTHFLFDIVIYTAYLCLAQGQRYETANGCKTKNGGARGVIIIIVGNGHDDTSSNPERDWLHFT